MRKKFIDFFPENQYNDPKSIRTFPCDRIQIMEVTEE